MSNLALDRVADEALDLLQDLMDGEISEEESRTLFEQRVVPIYRASNGGSDMANPYDFWKSIKARAAQRGMGEVIRGLLGHNA
jgi:hypothetical protein